MSSISADVNEYDNLEKEIKRLSIELRNLRKRKNKIGEQIIKYLNEKNQPGFKYNNMGIILETKQSRKQKPKKLSTEESIRILHEAGIRDADTILKKLKESSSQTTDVQKIKVVNRKM